MVSTDYGYLIGHRGRDGDPLDVLVCVSADLSEQFQLEVAHFFSVYKQLEHKPVEIGGWRSRADATKVIEDAARLHKSTKRAGRSAPLPATRLDWRAETLVVGVVPTTPSAPDAKRREAMGVIQEVW